MSADHPDEPQPEAPKPAITPAVVHDLKTLVYCVGAVVLGRFGLSLWEGTPAPPREYALQAAGTAGGTIIGLWLRRLLGLNRPGR